MAKTVASKPAVPMAPAYMKTDSIRFDTSKAPWMKFAQEELQKNVREHADYDSFAKLLYLSLAQQKGSGRRSYLLEDIVRPELGKSLTQKNPDVVKYFDGVKTDPARDPRGKGRSWDIAPTNEVHPGDWRVTAWCAAFVNWCLKRAGASHLGYATAEAWLRFGTPLPTPVYGCVAIIPPSSSTGSTTGHVAFYTEMKGEKILLLGGNQGDAVTVMEQQANRVLGYRWPTEFNYFLLDRNSAIV
jgi:uncharacterized protein (TIGR02594 family)